MRLPRDKDVLENARALRKSMTREERRAWIASRLDPIDGYDPSLANPLRSDLFEISK